LIQILRVKNLTRAVSLFPAQMAARINSVLARLIGTKWAQGVPEAAIGAEKTGFQSVPRFTWC
jgi:hypothetical protein